MAGFGLGAAGFERPVSGGIVVDIEETDMRGMVPDIYELTGCADPRVSPDGTRVAYVVNRIDREAVSTGARSDGGRRRVVTVPAVHVRRQAGCEPQVVAGW